eukprot:FR742753.1.p1 GENE.FR742753.1~~FR742753.1.p1  ORF type:complete len:217 (+),score=38.83 FR742753.1:2-652(+)
MRNTAKLVSAQPPPPTFAESEPDIVRVDLDAADEELDATLPLIGKKGLRFDIETHPDFPGQFRVVSRKLERLVAVTNWDYREAANRFDRVLEATGVLAQLEKAGAQEGDLIMIHDLDFEYSPVATQHLEFIPDDLLEQDEDMIDLDFSDASMMDELFDPADWDPNDEQLQEWSDHEVSVAQEAAQKAKSTAKLPAGVQCFEIDEDELYGDDTAYEA